MVFSQKMQQLNSTSISLIFLEFLVILSSFFF